MFSLSHRSPRSLAATALLVSFVGSVGLAPAPAAAQHHGGYSHGGYYHGGYYRGFGFGLGLGLLGLDAIALGGYPYYYPYGYYPPVVVQQPVIAVAPAVAAAPAAAYYYCNNPKGYYPAVASCLIPWQQVPIAPPPQ